MLSICIKGGQKSCGCLLSEMHTTHGGASDRLYAIWNCMKQRCGNPNIKEYKDYGARGIKVCEEWEHDYSAFKKWAYEHGYDENAKRGECTIERVNNNGNYSPQNCKIATQREQLNNTRRSIKVNFGGNVYSVSELAEMYNVPKGTIYYRIEQGRPPINEKEVQRKEQANGTKGKRGFDTE